MTNERDDLIAILDHHRELFLRTVAGITDEQARERTTVSELCLGGVVKHVGQVEERWARFVTEGPHAVGDANEAGYAAHLASFRMEPSETLAEIVATYERVAAATNELVRTVPSLDDAQPLPSAPWFEPGASWTARHVFMHILAETAQHAGHADILREALDGQKTMG
jgi:hypothetical protein